MAVKIYLIHCANQCLGARYGGICGSRSRGPPPSNPPPPCTYALSSQHRAARSERRRIIDDVFALTSLVPCSRDRRGTRIRTTRTLRLMAVIARACVRRVCAYHVEGSRVLCGVFAHSCTTYNINIINYYYYYIRLSSVMSYTLTRRTTGVVKTAECAARFGDALPREEETRVV